MRKCKILLAMALALALLAPLALAEPQTIDLENMTVAELTALRDAVEAQIAQLEQYAAKNEAVDEDVYPSLSRGNRGDAVKALQNKLIDLGYLTGKADGAFGPKTEQAVKDCQTALGLTADGVASPEMQTLLFQDEPAIVTPMPEPVPAEQPTDGTATAPEAEATPAPEATAAPTPEATAEPTPEPTPEPVHVAGGNILEAGTQTVGALAYSFRDLTFSKIVEPSNPDEESFYSFYEIEDAANTYLCLRGSISNAGTEAVLPQEIGFSLRVDGGDAIAGIVAFEDAAGQNLTSYTELGAGAATTLALLAEVPEGVAEGAQKLSCTLTLGGQVMEYEIR